MSIGMQITATGGTPQQRDLVTNVMARGLVESGFSNVAIVNTVGEPMVGTNVPSLMDVIREQTPDFLATPVRIWSIDTVDTLDVPEEDDGVPKESPNGFAVASSTVNMGERFTNIFVREPYEGVHASLAVPEITDSPKSLENAA